MEIYKLTPAYKDNLWGGTKLKTEWNKNTDLPIVAESWELSCHDAGPSVIANGENAGKTLKSVLTPEMLGSAAAKFEFFPVLIKLIDAKENLSVQVHPSDDYALKNEGEYGKTEMWYIVDHEPGAGIYCGFEKEISKEEFSRRIADNTLLDALRFYEVQNGECYFIPSGTIHAIGAGVTICEIQQNSNLTYRVYDYGRIDKKTGKGRELHVEKAVLVSDLTEYKDKVVPQNLGGGKELLARCPYFTVIRGNFAEKDEIATDGQSFLSVTFLSGEGEIEGQSFTKGDTFFIPANYGKVMLSGKGEYVLSKVE